jgi:hypothetical protein
LFKLKIQELSKKVLILILSIFAVANLLLYWPGNLYFLNDDFVHIPLTDGGVLFQQRSVRPIHELLVRFDLWLWHKQAFGFHITALLLHAIVCMQLYYLTIAIAVKYCSANHLAAQKAALLTVILFLLYPQNSESLTWILGRTPTLSAIFFLAMVQLFLTSHKTLFTYIFACIYFLLTLFTYEQSILFPLVFILIAFAAKDKIQKQQKLVFAATTILAAVIYVVARKLITTEVIGKYEGENFNGFNLQNLLGNAIRLMYRLFLNPSSTYYFIVGLAVVTAVFLVVLWLHKKELNNKRWMLWVVSIVVLLLPVGSLGITVRSFESGRYLYLPAIFLCLGLGIYLQQKSSIPWQIFIFCNLFLYWGYGKYQASVQFKSAFVYAVQVQQQVAQHFMQTPNKPLIIDTLHVTIHRLPVYRMGFKQGIHWLNPSVDTNSIKVNYYYDEFIEQKEN